MVILSIAFVGQSLSQEKCRVKKSKTNTQIYVEEEIWLSMLQDPNMHDAVVSQGHALSIPSGTWVVIKEKHDVGSKFAYAEVTRENDSKSFYMYLSALDFPKTKTTDKPQSPRKEKYIVRRTDLGWAPYSSEKDGMSYLILCYQTGRGLNNNSGRYFEVPSGTIVTKIEEDVMDSVPVVCVTFPDGKTGWMLTSALRKIN
jgi:hypothetical protein